MVVRTVAAAWRDGRECLVHEQVERRLHGGGGRTGGAGCPQQGCLQRADLPRRDGQRLPELVDWQALPPPPRQACLPAHTALLHACFAF